jgi:hypothetical protein
MAKGQEQTDENRKWPWDWQNKALTETVSAKIVKNLALYANDAVYRKPEEVGMSNSLDEGFLHYCYCVKDYFIKAVEKVLKHFKPKVSEIAEEAFRLIDRLVSIVEHHNENTCSWLELISQWDTLVRKFDMCMSSDEQQEQPAETGQDATPAKEKNQAPVIIQNFNKCLLGDVQAENVQTGYHASIYKQRKVEKKGIVKKLLRIVGFLAAMLTILHYFGWLGAIKAFIYKIVWSK